MISGAPVFPDEERVNGAMADPVPVLTSSDDESVEGQGGLTDSDGSEMDATSATSDYGSGEQQHVSDWSEEEGTDGGDWTDIEEEEDGDGGGGGEVGEVMVDAYATQVSDEVREEGNALVKEKKVSDGSDNPSHEKFL